MANKKDNYFLCFLILIIILVNYQFLIGGNNYQYYLNIQTVKEGQIWQILTHPFAHLSLYHLTTDLIVFLILFYELNSFKDNSKYTIIFLCFVFSSTAAFFSLPLYSASTFGGLSGINYGMLAFVCLQNFSQKENSTIFKFGSIFTLAFLIIKQVLESCFQINFLQEMHLGFVGLPIVESHAGGMLAALILYLISFKPKDISIGKVTKKKRSSIERFLQYSLKK